MSLIKEYESKQMEAFEEQMGQKLEEIDSEYEEKYKSFESFWQQRLDQYDQESKQILEQVKDQHIEAQNQKMDELNKKYEQNGKKSSKALDLEYKLTLLAKNQRYEEAAKVKKKLEKEYFRFMKRNQRNQEGTIQSHLQSYKETQLKELESLQQKININRKQLLSQKQKEYDNTFKQYKV